MSSFSLFDIINTVLLLLLLSLLLLLLWEDEWLPDPNIFLCIPLSAADATAINPKGIKTLLANGLITFFINGNLFLVMNLVIYQEILLIVLFLISEFLIT